MKIIITALLLIATAGATNFNTHKFCTVNGSEIWEERIYNDGKPISIVWAINFENYPNHKTVLTITEKPVNFGIFCKE